MAILNPAPNIKTMAQGPSTPWHGVDEEKEYAADPKEFMLERCRVWVDNMEVLHNWLISATYYLPAFGFFSNGQKFFRPDMSQDEALWQGKVGLVVAKGPMVFVDDEHVKFHGQTVDVGDWVQYDIHDGRQFTINRIHCRLIKDTQILAKVKDPSLVY